MTTSIKSRAVVRRSAHSAFALLAALGLAACDHTSEAPNSNGPAPNPHPHSETAPTPPASALPSGHPVMPGGRAGMGGGMGGMQAPAPRADDLAWTDPPGWQRVPPASAMRRAQFRIPAVGGDTGDAELAVFTFGQGQGGDIEANLQRWYGQVAQPDGRPTSAVATRRTFSAGALEVTLTEAPGRIGGGGGPMAMPGAPAAPTFEHGRLLAAIVQTPQGPWFFKLTGGDATVTAARPAFEAMLRSMHAGAAAPPEGSAPAAH